MREGEGKREGTGRAKGRHRESNGKAGRFWEGIGRSLGSLNALGPECIGKAGVFSRARVRPGARLGGQGDSRKALTGHRVWGHWGGIEKAGRLSGCIEQVW